MTKQFAITCLIATAVCIVPSVTTHAQQRPAPPAPAAPGLLQRQAQLHMQLQRRMLQQMDMQRRVQVTMEMERQLQETKVQLKRYYEQCMTQAKEQVTQLTPLQARHAKLLKLVSEYRAEVTHRRRAAKSDGEVVRLQAKTRQLCSELRTVLRAEKELEATQERTANNLQQLMQRYQLCNAQIAQLKRIRVQAMMGR